MIELFLLLIVATSYGYVESDRDSSSDGDIPDELEQALYRRLNREWSYNGIPIEAPLRRGSSNRLEDELISSDEGPQTVRRQQRRQQPQALLEHSRRNSLPARPSSSNRRNQQEDRIVSQQTTTPPETETTTATSPPTLPSRSTPPLNRRYRRIFDPDEMAAVNEFPFMASVLVNHQHWCGGAIISPDTVLTAAHCLQLQYNNRFFREYVKMLSVRVGSSNATGGGQVLRVEEIFFHPNYKPNVLEFNIALLKLHKNLTLDPNSNVNMIEYSTDRVIPIDRNITFLGWGSVLALGGKSAEHLLQKVDLPIYDLADCQEIYGRELVTKTNFCAGYITIAKNVCNHDAGGPAVMDGLLVGTLSFSARRCDATDRPAVFTNVAAMAAWLNDHSRHKLDVGGSSMKSSDWIPRQ